MCGAAEIATQLIDNPSQRALLQGRTVVRGQVRMAAKSCAKAITRCCGAENGRREPIWTDAAPLIKVGFEQKITPGGDEWGHQKNKECIAISMVQPNQLMRVVIPSSHCAMAANAD